MTISRRTALQALATAGAAAQLPKKLRAGARAASPEDKAILYDATRCIGCRQCAVGCAEENGWDPELALSDDPEAHVRVAHRGASLRARRRGHLPEGAVHALRRAGLRERLHARRDAQGRGRRRGLERRPVRRVPLLRDRLPLQHPALRVGHAGSLAAEVPDVPRAPGPGAGAGLRGAVPSRRADLRVAHGDAGRGAPAHRRQADLLQPEGLRGARRWRYRRPLSGRSGRLLHRGPPLPDGARRRVRGRDAGDHPAHALSRLRRAAGPPGHTRGGRAPQRAQAPRGGGRAAPHREVGAGGRQPLHRPHRDHGGPGRWSGSRP